MLSILLLLIKPIYNVDYNDNKIDLCLIKQINSSNTLYNI